MSFLGFLQWLEETTFSTSLRESVYMWAVVDGLHIVGLCVFLGLLLFWELRLFDIGVRTARCPKPGTACRPGSSAASSSW